MHVTLNFRMNIYIYIYKVFLVVVFNVWNGVTNGTLVVPTFQEVTTIFFTTVSSMVGFEPWSIAMAWWAKSTTAQTEAQSGVPNEVDLHVSNYIITIVTHDDKRDKFTLQTDISKCGHVTIVTTTTSWCHKLVGDSQNNDIPIGGVSWYHKISEFLKKFQKGPNRKIAQKPES